VILLKEFAKVFPMMVALIATLGPLSAEARRNFGPHKGYLENVDGERDKKYQELEFFQPPPPLGRPISERIFNEKLSKEFRDKYEEKFGRTEIERVYQSPNRTTYYNDVYGPTGTLEEINKERKEFGDFMFRRLAEYHVDDYLKNDPSARPIYEVKERISNVRVEVSKIRIDIQYSIAGNTLDLKLNNPYLDDTKIRVEMDPESIGPSSVNETRLMVGKRVTKTVFMQSDYLTQKGVVSLVGRKTLTRNLSSSLTAATYTNGNKANRRETIYLSGVTYAF